MYILIKDTAPSGHALNCAAHASAVCTYKHKDDPIVQKWITTEYYKVSCRVTPEQFEEFKKYDDWIVIAEERCDDQEISMAFKPREKYPRVFKDLPLWGSG